MAMPDFTLNRRHFVGAAIVGATTTPILSAADQAESRTFTILHIKNCLEFLIYGNPNLPGQYFPRVSGMRFRYDTTRTMFEAVTEIELGDLDPGYRQIDISEKATALHGVACNLYLGVILASIRAKTKGTLSVKPKTKDGAPLKSRADALPSRQSSPYLLPPKGSIDGREVVQGSAPAMEIKEWQAIIDYLKGRPRKNEQGVALLTVDTQTAENRSVNIGG